MAKKFVEELKEIYKKSIKDENERLKAVADATLEEIKKLLLKAAETRGNQINFTLDATVMPSFEILTMRIIDELGCSCKLDEDNLILTVSWGA